MMRILLNIIIVLILISLFSCKKDTSLIGSINTEFSSADDSNIPDSIRTLYQSDAAYLTYRYIYENEMSDTALVHLPQHLIDSFYNGLIHIYNCKTIASIDTITKFYPVHAFHEVSVYRLIVGFDTSFSWTKKWEAGITITGNDTLDSIITQYEFELSGKARYGFAVLVTKTPLNMRALEQEFIKIAGVRYAEPDGALGSGNDITATLNMDIKHYTFTIGWGDCPSGCMSRRFWEFSVSTNGEVKFLRSYGNSWP